MRRAAVVVLLLTIAAYFFLPTPPAFAVEHNLAGSVQLDYHAVPANMTHARQSGVPDVLDGFTVEGALKLAADISDHLSANVKLCYGCHGFEMDMAYFDLRAADELNLRVGRFSPSFGSFNLRHDTANHKLSDKPLPYDMGRMLRFAAWNLSVLPSPFPDNGVEVNGTHWFSEKVDLDYAIYAVSGFKTASERPYDLDFFASHNPYYVDNNSRPALGSRVALTVKLGQVSDATLGGSFMAGTYDPKSKFAYAIAGSDLVVRVDRTTFRLEYLARRQWFDTSNLALFKYPVGSSDFFTKHGAFVELEQGVTRELDLIGRLDGMYRIGNVLLTNELSNKASVGRATLGAAVAVERNLRFKGSAELWVFTDQVGGPHRYEETFHLGAVGSF